LDHEISELDRQRRVMRQHARSNENGTDSYSSGNGSLSVTTETGTQLRRKSMVVEANETKTRNTTTMKNNQKDDHDEQATSSVAVSIAWNFRDFSVKYTASSRASFVVVNGIYLEPLVRGSWTSSDFPIHPTYRRHFFEQVYRR
tara:strand:+ start:82 stop:513 length:432 start_codon:yes stop_codon:yes gene_type:complete